MANAKKTTEKAGGTKSALAARLARAGAPAATPAPVKKTGSAKRATARKAAPAAPARQTLAPQARPLRRPEHPDTPVTDIYTKRINFFITPDMERALTLAKLDDGLTVAARLRGMIEYWMEGLPQHDPETGETTPTGRQTKAIDLRARKHRG